MNINRYAILNCNCGKAPEEDVYAHIFEASTPEEIVAELIRIGATDEGYSVEEYEADEDGEFLEGSDYDSVSNFIKRTCAARSIKTVCKMAGMTQRALSLRFGIPIRTVEDWCRGVSKCPEYTNLMMQEILGLYRR
jgi:DNA-binding transcriptional regulator YiaG